MKVVNGFHRRAQWCGWTLLTIAAILVLPIFGRSQHESQPAASDNQTAAAMKPKRVSEAIPLRYIAATDAVTTINGFLGKKSARNLASIEQWELPAIVAEPFNNHLFVSAIPEDIAEIKRLLKAMDVAPKQYIVDAVVCEGEPVPTVREALDKGKIKILKDPRIVTMENRSAVLNIEEEQFEFPAGSGQKRFVGFKLEVTVGRANDNKVPVSAVTDLSSKSKDSTTINVHRMEHTAIHTLGGQMRLRYGMSDSGKERWIVMSVAEVTSAK